MDFPLKFFESSLYRHLKKEPKATIKNCLELKVGCFRKEKGDGRECQGGRVMKMSQKS